MSVVLADTSVWARRDQRAVRERLAEAIDANAAAITDPLMLELLRSARSRDELTRLAALYESLHVIPTSPAVTSRARAVQAALAARGQHRGPSPVDLLTAAAAELTGAAIWHCDKHFDQIAALTGQPAERIGR